MSNVVQFPGVVHIEINTCVVVNVTAVGAYGARKLTHEIGRRMYFVDVVEADGGRIGMWDGADRAEAYRIANELKRDFDGRIRDLCGDAA